MSLVTDIPRIYINQINRTDTVLPGRIHKTRNDDVTASLMLRKVLDSLHSRRSFLKGIGMSLGYGALSACGSSDDSSSNNSAGDILVDDGTDDPPVDDGTPAPPTVSLPPASAEYNVLKRTSFGVHRDSLSSILNSLSETWLIQSVLSIPTWAHHACRVSPC